MKTIQLRRYTLNPGAGEAFLAWWQQVIPALRRVAGFDIEFAFVNDEASEFIWAVSVPGDKALFKQVEKDYMSSPSRASAFQGIPDWVSQVHTSFVEEAF